MEIENKLKEIENLNEEVEREWKRRRDLEEELKRKLIKKTKPIVDLLGKIGVENFSVEYKGYKFDLNRLTVWTSGLGDRSLINDRSALKVFIENFDEIVSIKLREVKENLSNLLIRFKMGNEELEQLISKLEGGKHD